MKRATITLTVTIDFVDGQEDPIEILHAAVAADHEGRIGEIIEPHVDAIEDVEEVQ